MHNLHVLVIQAMRIAHNFLLDTRYGGFLGLNLGLYDIFRRPGTRSSSPAEFTYSPYHWLACLSNSDPECLREIFKDRIKPSDVLVDVGCGRGRVINWWLDNGYRNQIFGLELDGVTAERTRRRLRNYKNVTIITGDAVQNIPASGTLFYLFNPFDAATLGAFKDRLKEISIDPKNIRILYYTPEQAHVFEDDPDWSVQIEPIGSSTEAQFNPVAIITLKQ